jgi:menaquinone-dependent protoporphyrinogen oxidase
MTEKILVTYASRTGATAGVAEAITQTLTKGGAAVDVLPMSDVKDLKEYSAVVAGSAIQGGQWLPEAMKFIQSNKATLSQKPFAAFLVCMTLAMSKGNYRDHVATWMAPVREIVRPVSEGLFAGSMEINKMKSFGDRIKFKMSVAMGVWAEGDHRNWDAIHQWAESIRPKMIH